ncbi:MAG TPA: hypothetical protein ENO22_11085 [candidate division Zixibacteria bacterium]|nr:hypothetical protein [candidate division Zixibacteria bacterium]
MFKNSLITVLVSLLLGACFLFLGCDDDGNGPQDLGNTALKLAPAGLPSLMEDDGLVYELWVADTVDESTIASLGKFFWDNDAYEFLDLLGSPRSDVFNLPEGKTTSDYNLMFITFEPYPDTDEEGTLNYAMSAQIIEEYPILWMKFDEMFAEVAGYYVLTSLSDFNLDESDTAAYEISGLWFAEVTPGDFGYNSLTPGLLVPTLSQQANMTYEGWVYMQGWEEPLSLGKFRNAQFRDYSNPYIDNQYAPLLPGEDFLMPDDAPAWIIDSFPLVLVGDRGDTASQVFITLEPYPDPDEANPFPLVLLSRNLPFLTGPSDRKISKAHKQITMGNRYINLPTIQVTRTARED